MRATIKFSQFLVLSATMVSSLACTTVPGRSPASLALSEGEGRLSVLYAAREAENFEQSFREFFASDDLRPALLLRIARLEEIYFRTRTAMAEFDAALSAAQARGLSLEEFYDQANRALIYPRILALREADKKAQRELASIYFGLFSRRATSDRASPESIKATQGIHTLNQYFRQAQGASREALNPVGDYLASTFLQAGDGHGELRESLSGIYNLRLNDPNAASAVENISKNMATKETALQRTVEARAAEIRDQLLSRYDGREPQAAKIAPGVGPSGNITGNGFPAKVWSLTFDDGPHATRSMAVVKSLQERGMKGTFFLLGQNVKALPSVVKQQKEAGMDLANHSYTHPQLTKLETSKVRTEIFNTSRIIEDLTGERPRLIRFPYGAGTNVERVRSVAADAGLVHVFWNVDSLDWQDKNPVSVFGRVKKQMAMSKGGIILFHDIHSQSVTASAMVMDYLKEQGMRVESIQGAIDLVNGE